MEKDFSVGAVIQEASVIIRKNFWGLIGQYLLIMLISFLFEIILGNAGFMAGIVIGYVLVKWALVCVQKGRVSFDDLFADLTFKKFIYFICTIILVALAIIWPTFLIMLLAISIFGIGMVASGGMMANLGAMGAIAIVALLVSFIPLILLYVPRMFAKFIAVEKNITPTKALCMSKKITKGVRAKLLWLLIVLILINIVGILCLIIGVFYTAPLTALTIAVVYKKLSRETETVSTEDLPVAEEVIVEEVDVITV